MKKLITTFLSLVLMCTSTLFATTFLVQPGTTGWRTAETNETLVDLTGTTLDAWYTTATIEAGDQVWILAGTYTLAGPITPKGGESIYGGFAGTETSIAARTKGTNAWNFINETILDGGKSVDNSTGNAVFSGAVNTTPVTTIGGLTITNGINLTTTNTGSGATLSSNTTMQNCKITNCYLGAAVTGTSTAGVQIKGGAQLLNSYIYNNYSAASAGGVTILPDGIIDGCTIDSNTALLNAGGLYINSGSGGGAKVLNCTITNNSATTDGSASGGGINVWQTEMLTSNIEITNTTISNNFAAKNGGALNVSHGNALTTNYNTIVFTNVTMNGNKATSAGGAVYVLKGNILLDNCTLNGNSAGATGGAINIGSSFGATINNTKITNNTVPAANAGSAIISTYQLTCNNVIIAGNKGKQYLSVTLTTAGTPGAVFNNCTVASNVLSATDATATTSTLKTVNACAFTNCLFYNCNSNPLFFQTASGGVAPSVKNCGFDATAAAKVSTYTDLGGNISTISSASFVDATNGDWHLSSGSVAINAGTTIAGITTDIAGSARPYGATAFDMGAYEYSGSTAVSQIANELNCKITANAVTKNITIESVVGSKVIIYNLVGRVLKSAISNSDIMSLSTSDMNSGVYIIEVVSEGKRSINKIII